MKPHFLSLLAVSLICLPGCGRQSSAIPDRSFRLSVSDVFASDDERVSFLTVETRGDQKYSVRAKSVHLGDGARMETNPNTGLHQERVLTFVCSRVSPDQSQHDYIKTILRRGEKVTMTDMREFPRGTALTQMAALTVQSGVYPLSKALTIGRLNGEDLLLTVGDIQMETARK